MKGDFSRLTFIKERHYSGVLMQQGRVQVDADWNEQQAIQQHRVETETGDVIGLCGAPQDAPGFKITVNKDNLVIGKGRYYVDGILCENEEPFTYEIHRDRINLPGVVEPLSLDVGLVYLDVWQRHITALEDAHIREKALGGPDTATRTKTEWQVRISWIKDIKKLDQISKLLQDKAKLQKELQKAGSEVIKITNTCDNLAKILRKLGVDCSSQLEWDNLIAASTGKLSARTQSVTTPKGPCNVSAGAGYQRLENQLYRIEIHKGGSFKPQGKTEVSFKWSRENGSIVTAWTEQNGPNLAFLTVANPGRDGVLGFAADQWVELTGDKHELDGVPGTLVQLLEVKGNTLTIDPATASATIKIADFSHNPKVRRWESPGGVVLVDRTSTDDGWHAIEDGIQVQFSPGTYHTGDYWMIPARTEGGEIEWPPYEIPNKNPEAKLPLGIQHHYCRLALISVFEGKLCVLEDCRQIFPPLTGLINFYYVGGDAQEAVPDLAQTSNFIQLAEPLQVGVSNWRWPVAGEKVRFTITQGNGQLQNSDEKGVTVTVNTNIDGIASCTWELDPTKENQQVKATLLDKDEQPMQTPIYFHANLNVARQVAYEPGKCGTLQNQKTVQDAIDRLSQLVSLYHVSGDAQAVMPGEKLEPLVVQAASPCGPVEGVKVRFEIKSGNGKVNGSIDPVQVTTIAGGIAQCEWMLDSSTHKQEVQATLLPDLAYPSTPPIWVRFTANLSVARQVAYDPDPAKCSALSDVQNVQEAIDKLCQRQVTGGCTVAVRPKDDNLNDVINDLLKQGRLDICICLMPGDHFLEKLEIQGTMEKPVNLKITGCGPGTRIDAKDTWRFVGLNAFTMRDVQVLADGVQDFMIFDHCAEVALESCHLKQVGPKPGGFLCRITASSRIQLVRNILEGILAQKSKVPPGNIFKGIDDGIVKLFTIEDRREFSRQAGKASENLAATDVSTRRTFAQKLKKTVAKAKKDLTDAELSSYNNLASIMEGEAADTRLVAGAMNAVFEAANEVPGLALILDSPEADALLVENRIVGEISLYGAPAADDLKAEEVEKLAAKLHEGSIALDGSMGILHLCSNQLTVVTAGARIIEAIREDKILKGIYRSASLTDNWIGTRQQGFTALVAERLTLTANSYDATTGMHAGTVIAAGATFTGNQALNTGVVLIDISGFQGTNKAANVGINIVEM